MIYQPTSTFLLCRFWWRVFWIVLRSCYSGSEGRSPSTSRSRSRAGPSAGCRYCTPERGTPRRTQSPASSSCLQRCVAMRAAGLVVAAIVVVIQIYFLCLNPSAALARPTRQSETHREVPLSSRELFACLPSPSHTSSSHILVIIILCIICSFITL